MEYFSERISLCFMVMEMKDKLIGLTIGLIIVAVVYGFPLYIYSLTILKDIAEELKKIRKVIEDKKVTE